MARRGRGGPRRVEDEYCSARAKQRCTASFAANTSICSHFGAISRERAPSRVSIESCHVGCTVHARGSLEGRGARVSDRLPLSP